MNIEHDDTETIEAPQRRQKKKKLTEILASMSADEADSYLSNFPVHATTMLDGEWRDRFSHAEEENALRAAARSNWKY